MRVITPSAIGRAMQQHAQWKVGLKLWLDTFDSKDLSFCSYQSIKDCWASASGWNTDRIPARKLDVQSKKGPLDMYVFDIHKNDCRILAWGSPAAHTFYIKGVYSHAEYDKWWKSQVKN